MSMTLPPKVVSVLCLIQILLISIGFLLTRSFLRLFDAAFSDSSMKLAKVPVLSEFIRYYGLWFLLIPLAWGLASILNAANARNAGSVPASQVAIGGVLTILLIVLFGMSGGQAFHLTLSPFDFN